MGVGSKETWYQSVFELFDTFTKRFDEKIEKEQQQLKACKKQSALEAKLAQELKLHNEHTDRLAEVSRRSTELGRVRASFESHPTITDSDKNRLDNTKESYQLAKELTSIRLDFSASPNVAKGYIKSESRKLLQPFEVPASDDAALWALIQTTAAPCWLEKEN